MTQQEKYLWSDIFFSVTLFLNGEQSLEDAVELYQELDKYSIRKRKDIATLGCGELENENSGV